MFYRLLVKIAELFNSVAGFIISFVVLTVRLIFDVIFRLVDILLPLTRIAAFIYKYIPKFWHWVTHIGFVKRTISRNVFRKFAGAAPPRPHISNMAAPYATWKGLVDRSYTGRHIPASFDQVNKKRPSESEIVELFMRNIPKDGQTTQIDSMRSTFMFAAFAQWFTDSFLRTAHAFDFDKNGNVIRDKNGAPLRLDGRETRNTSNHEIDLCQIYGLNEKQTDILRLKDESDKGCLKFIEHDDGEYPPFLLSKAPKNKVDDKGKPVPVELPLKKEFVDLHPDEKVIRSIFLRADKNTKGYETIFATGLEHSNATIGNALLNVIFLRQHNLVAREISKKHTDWDDEQVFQTARNVMIVLLLKIVISDYVRHISPLNLPLEFQPHFAEKFDWYRTNRISIEFNLLYRWHSLVPDLFTFMPDPADAHSFRHNNNWLLNVGVGKAVELFSGQNAGKMVLGNTPRFLKGVKADTIRLMRDSNLASYNDYKERFKQPRAKKFSDVTNNASLAGKLSDMYKGDIDALEWYVGLHAENHKSDMVMGDLMLAMVAHDAFTMALTNPLLSKEVFTEKTFSDVGWKIIQETSTLSQVVKNVTGADVCKFSQFGI